jgi:ubiquinone biosynthesis protein
VSAAAWRHLLWPFVRRRDGRSRAERMQALLEDLGGTWVKLGQALALRFDLLPADYCFQFFQLLNQVRPFPAGEVREILEAELGGRVEDLFRSFDWTPLAAASIGQVHRAVLPDGTAVAVKVQRPGIRRLVRADLRFMRILAGATDVVIAGARARELVGEFARWTEEELDYRTEARHASVLRRNAAGDELERNARVFPQYTTGRVLTLEYLEGPTVLEVIAAIRRGDSAFLDRLAAAGHDTRRIASHVVWNALNQIYRFGYFHADPHPANLIVLPEDAIGYVDFGIVGKLDDQTTDSLRYFAQSLFAGRTQKAVDEFLRFLTPSRRTDVSAARRDLVEAMRNYVESARAGPDGFDLTDEIFEIEMLALVRKHGMALSSDAVRYLKAVLTAEAMVKELDPQFDLRAHENRFFGRLLELEAREFWNVAGVSQRLLDARFRFGRVLEAVESLREAPHQLVSVARDVRSRVQASSVLTILGWLGILAAVWTTRARGTLPVLGLPFRAVAVGAAIAGLILLVFSILQVRRLPADAQTAGFTRYPRRLR